MSEQPQTDEREVLRAILDGLHQLDEEARARILKTAETFFGLDLPHVRGTAHPGSTPDLHRPANSREPQFSNRAALSPKDFLLQKEPVTDVERIACLAYYLTHYRDNPHFKTIDLSKLNTEAAQLKFSNAAYAVSNAERAALIAPAGKGNKQLSALGERFVDALPDRDAAKEVLSTFRNRRSRKKSAGMRRSETGSGKDVDSES